MNDPGKRSKRFKFLRFNAAADYKGANV